MGLAEVEILDKETTPLSSDHSSGKLTFVYPFTECEGYVQVAEQLSLKGLAGPTMEETANLVYSTFQNPEGRYSGEVLSKLKYLSSWLWAFNGLLSTKSGVYIQDDPKISDDGEVLMDQLELENKIKEGDTSVRFVPRGYKTGRQTSSELSKNTFVKALAGEEGAQKLAEIADKYPQDPYVGRPGSISLSGIEVCILEAYVSFFSQKESLQISVDNGFGSGRGYARGCALGISNPKRGVQILNSQKIKEARERTIARWTAFFNLARHPFYGLLPGEDIPNFRDK